MPKKGEKRGSISNIKPTGWIQSYYKNVIKEEHVLYRVTPIFEGTNMVANGVEMEAYSVEDNGKGVCFNIYCYNVQPGINIDYATR